MNRAIRKIESFLQTENGQRFLQYGYSFGAAIVIFGAMVKVLHWWGVWGNIIFGTGMAIEVVVFILYGLDRPPKSYRWENVFPVLETEKAEDRPHFEKSAVGVTSTRQGFSEAYQPAPAPQQSHSETISPNENLPKQSGLQVDSGSIVAGDHIEELQSVSENVSKFAHATETLTQIADALQDSYRHIIDNSHEVGLNTLGYVQQMEALNRNVSGLNAIYEIQLRSISGQIETLDEINRGLKSIKEMYGESVPDSSRFNEETEKMTRQIQELNQIYGRLIQAMTSNPNPQ